MGKLIFFKNSNHLNFKEKKVRENGQFENNSWAMAETYGKIR